MTAPSPIAGIVLAAGRSTRLGQTKQLLELDGRPILQIVIENAARSRLSPVYLVLGSQHERISGAIGDLGQTIVVNPDYAQGQSTSLTAGLRELPPNIDAVMVLLGDQPQVSSDLIDLLIDSFAASTADIVQPVYRGTPGNPVVFRRSVVPDLLKITGDRGARDVIKARQNTVLRVPIADRDVPLDVDTMDDYGRLKDAWESMGR